ncbi:MAG: hypothetical protein E7218_04165 [Anaerofustis stercorihominis]|nr:hypothetical protein [Anaerofustis stercorihominis]
MNKKTKDRLLCIVMAAFLFVSAAICIIRPSQDYSVSERRPLEQMPEISIKTIFNGKFMENFEDYATDQFPLRDVLRSVKAYTQFRLLGKSDNNDVYMAEGYLNKLDYPLNETSLINAANKFTKLYDKYLQNSEGNIYLSIIPDKNYFFAEKNGYPSIDYKNLVNTVTENTPFAEYIDIFPYLEGSDYYRTDTHWKQESLTDIAGILVNRMGGKIPSEEYTAHMPDVPFYGVYTAQYALDVNSDNITYLTNDVIDSFIVYDHQNGKEIPVYDTDKLSSADAYEIYLGGPLSLVTIDNPSAETDKELIIFRDSFASSIAPLMAQAYSKVTLIDIRYLRSDMLENFVEFNGQDVLFLYSTMVLNNSETLK